MLPRTALKVQILQCAPVALLGDTVSLRLDILTQNRSTVAVQGILQLIETVPGIRWQSPWKATWMR